ncbi:MAG TPA: hypothetical protein VF283_19805 [Bryobacteraceae bacterium]
MGKAVLTALAAILLSGTVPAFALGTPPAHQKDVPKQQPGKRNPDLKQDKRQHVRGHKKETRPKHVNPGDVPQQKPAKRNPDQKQEQNGPEH